MLLFLPPGISSNQTTHHNKRRVSNSSRTSDGCLTDITRSHAYPRRQSMTECLEVSEDPSLLHGAGKIPAMIDLPKKLHISFFRDYRNIEVHRLRFQTHVCKMLTVFIRRSISTKRTSAHHVSGNTHHSQNTGTRYPSVSPPPIASKNTSCIPTSVTWISRASDSRPLAWYCYPWNFG
jgi:hypothetical protein